ncbi:MAG: hypothetical protein IPG49_14245 [Proteobacteria bacterium]|nr:hypothetical protein [Pseudomonadota bacterium]
MARPEGSAGALRRAAWITGVLVFSAGMTGSVTAASAKRSAVKQDAATVRSDAALDKARLAIREKNFDGAMRELDTLAKRGNAHAMYLLGALLLANPAGEPDPARALPLLEKAAAAGVPRAAYLLSVELANRAPADEAGARRWLDAAAQGGMEEARALIQAGRLPMAFLPAQDLAEQSARDAAWLRAARTDDVSLLRQLADAKTPSGAVDDFGRAALSVAAVNDAARAVEWLLAAGAVVDARDQNGMTALLLAAAAPKGAAIPALLAAKADPRAADLLGNTALHRAAMVDTAERVSALFAAGAAPNPENKDGDRPLDIALRRDAKPVATALQAGGAEPSRPPSARSEALSDVQRAKARDAYTGMSDLDVAATRRNTSLLKTLLARGTWSAGQKNSALFAATDAGVLEAVDLLLAAGATAQQKDSRGRTPAGTALQQADAALLERLLKAGASATQPGNTGAPLLVEAKILRPVSARSSSCCCAPAHR